MNKNKPIISIIIPVVNEALNIDKYLSKFSNLLNTEIIFVDGGSEDNTVELIEKKGFNVIKSPVKMRSFQMNLGAKNAQGDTLLFLHGDSILPPHYLTSIKNILAEKNTIAGAFCLKIDSEKKVFRFIELMVNWRSHILELPYGDQGIFIKKAVFQEISGFKEMPIMEDFELVKRLQKLGKIRIASETIITSARRWQKLGIVKTTLINQLMIIGYYLNINPQKLANFYRRNHNK